MPGDRPHYKLEAWKEAMALVSMTYRASQNFPIEFAQFLSISMGSISELETQLLIAVNLGYLDKDSPIFGRLEQTSKLVSGLNKSVRS